MKVDIKAVLEANDAWNRGDPNGRKAYLKNADLEGADLEGVNLRCINLDFANLRHANLHRAILGGSSLIGANMENADLSGIHLAGADLSYANLRHSILGGATLRHSNLTGANLRGANLARTNLWGANLEGACVQNVLWSAPTTVLLADWGHLPDDLARQAMAFSASCHPDPAAFTRWAAGGDDPYEDVNVQRSVVFRARRELWTDDLIGLHVNPYNLMTAILAFKCVLEDPACA